jgi:hypothetical protein
MLMKIACSLAIAVGLYTVTIAIRVNVSATQAALGVFMIMIGLQGFTSSRIAKLEQAVNEMKGTVNTAT